MPQFEGELLGISAPDDDDCVDLCSLILDNRLVALALRRCLKAAVFIEYDYHLISRFTPSSSSGGTRCRS